MPLTDKQKEKIQEIVNLLWKKGCYVCGCIDWELFEDFVVYSVYDMEYKMPIGLSK